MKQHDILEKFISGLSKGLTSSLIITSKAGCGKTETTLHTLDKMGLREGIEYIYANNYITPVELYLLLKKVNNLEEPKILILDDVEETIRNTKAIGLLKGALWEAGGKRKVSWTSGSHKIQEQSFNFEGKIIFLLNQFNLSNPLIYSIKDRSFFFEIVLNNTEIIELMKERAKKPYQDISYQQKIKIVEYISKVGITSDKLSLRTLQQAFNLYLISPNSWQILVNKLL